MNIYENIVILNAALSDEDADAIIIKIKDIITNSSGEILKVSVWGKRKLSYEIKKQKKGLYVLICFKTNASTIKKLQEFYKVSDSVIKYMVVHLGPKQAKELEKELEKEVRAAEVAAQKSEA
jgi:small subunit ribosomal protein S6